jgi:uncharacterized spore protein YtfJ
MKTKDLIQQLSDKFSSDANVKSVYGDPIETQNKTIIPVAKIAYGLGAGGAQGMEEKEKGEAGGGGGGVSNKPVGVLEITKEDTRFVPVDDWKQKVQWIGVGALLGLLIYRWIR